jgi:hypothetical protein
MQKNTLTGSLIVAVLGLAATAHAGLDVVPFTEDFTDGPQNWFDAPGTSVVSWSADGGPNGAGDGYISTSFAFADIPDPTLGTSIFRAQDEFNSSGNAFVGDWIAGGVNEVSFWFRHDAPAPVNVFARFASPVNFPAAVGLVFQPILPNTWTQVSVPLFDGSPNLIYEGPFGFGDVFSSVGHLQLGILPPMGFENDPTLYTFDVDKVSIVPAPGALALLGLAAFARRRRRNSKL